MGTTAEKADEGGGVDWFGAGDYWLARLVLQRAIGVLYLVAFLSAVHQFRPLLGEHGLLPVPRLLARASFRRAPSLFHLCYSDRLATAVCWAGAVLAASLVAGLPQAGPAWVPILVWLALWALYLSIVNVGQIFYGFGWESLLLEAGFLAAFLGSDAVAPPVLVIWLFRWLLFRVEFGAGLIKLRGDPCWRDLTCLYYHHETQPMPGPLSWYFHQLPRPLHRVEVAANHFAQLVVPFGLFAPQPVASIAAGIVIVTQGWLVLSGNFSWLNALTMVLAVAAIDDDALGRLAPGYRPPEVAAAPYWWVALVLAVALLVAVLSYWPIRNLLSRHQRMNTSFNPLHLVGAYGAFGSITRRRYEVVVEGTDAVEPGPEATWREYEFWGKPGEVRRRPPQYAPYHLRLDWLMWFAAMSAPQAHPWFAALLVKLLQGDPAVLRLLRVNPFPHAPPTYVRALLYHYRFATPGEHRESGVWWVRRPVGEYVPPMSLDAARSRSARL